MLRLHSCVSAPLPLSGLELQPARWNAQRQPGQMSSQVKAVSVRTFPSNDIAFATHVSRARERVGIWDATRVLDLLREAYPDVAATKATPGTTLERDTDCWYVFRDGAVHAPTADDGWTDDVSLPRTIVGPNGRYVDANGAAAELFGVPRETIIGSPAGSFTAHEDDDELGRQLLDLASHGKTVRSVAVVKRPSGDVRIEFAVRRIRSGRRHSDASPPRPTGRSCRDRKSTR